MFKKIAIMLCLLLLVVGIVSAAENNSTDDTLKTDEDNVNEIVKIQDEKVMNENPKSTITVKFVNAVTGEEYGSLSNRLAQGGSWGIGKGQFNNMIAGHETFKMDGYRYTFTYWSRDNGIVDSTQLLYCTGKDYTVTFYANYNKELLGRLTFIINDDHGDNGNIITYSDEEDFIFTFNGPADVDEGYEFMYYENAKTGEIYNPGEVFSKLYSEFQGQDVTVEFNAVYEKIADENPVNDTNATGDNGTITDNNTTENETDTNGTVTDNNTAENKTDTNETVTDNNTADNKTDTNETVTDNNTAENETDTNKTVTDNNAAENETDTNETVTDNGADGNNQSYGIDCIKEKRGNDSESSDDGNITGTLTKHKTAIAFTGLMVLVTVFLSVLIYTRRYNH